MGLDMYLEREIFIGAEYNDVVGTINLSVDGNPVDIEVDEVQSITSAIGYWRKANHIHSWFINNVQDGEDDCGSYTVSTDQFKWLLKDCNEVLEDRSLAPELLPTEGGFFFGSKEYDDNYFEEIKETVVIITKALKYSDRDTITYSSSW